MSVNLPIHGRSSMWSSLHNIEGGHYNNYTCSDEDGMMALRIAFPHGTVNEMNFVLFSTSGVHGTYCTIEEVEESLRLSLTGVELDPEDDDYVPIRLTFLIVQPRICTLRHGNCIPVTLDDIEYLKKLRAGSWEITQYIGAPE